MTPKMLQKRMRMRDPQDVGHFGCCRVLEIFNRACNSSVIRFAKSFLGKNGAKSMQGSILVQGFYMLSHALKVGLSWDQNVALVKLSNIGSDLTNT